MAIKKNIFKKEDQNYKSRLMSIFITYIQILLVLNIFIIPILYLASWEDDVKMNWNYIIYLNLYSIIFSITFIPIRNIKIKKLCQISVISIILITMIILFFIDVSIIEKYHLIEAIVSFGFYSSLDKLITKTKL